MCVGLCVFKETQGNSITWCSLIYAPYLLVTFGQYPILKKNVIFLILLLFLNSFRQKITFTVKYV